MEVITSLENKKVKELSKLLMKKYRDESNLFLVEGEHLVLEALKNNVLLETLMTEDYGMVYDVKNTFVTYDIIKKLSTTLSPQKVIGVCKKIEEKEIGNKVLILDDIQDPGNLGTIIRSAVAFNFDTIILSSNTVDLYNDKVIRSSEGMLFNINIIKRDTLEVIEYLHINDYKIYGTRVDDGRSVNDANAPSRFACIVGNEGNGVRKEVLDMCDEYLYINMNNKCESLNVGVAASILMYELGK